jgi:hypothetical protein
MLTGEFEALVRQYGLKQAESLVDICGGASGCTYLYPQLGSPFRLPSETIDRRKHPQYRASKCISYVDYDLIKR